MNRWTRKLHRWGALITAIPLLLVIVSGLMLQLKKQVPWVQPPTKKGIAPREIPQQSFQDLLNVAKTEHSSVQDWSDIDRLDVQVSKGIVKILTKDHWELQIDLRDGKVLSSKYRRSDFIEQLHDGSFLGDWAKLWIFFPNGLVLFGLWLTGAYLWYLPIASRRKKRARLAE